MTSQIEEKTGGTKALRVGLTALVSLNAVDMVITAWVVSAGVAIELNPVMAFALGLGTWAFVLVKSAMVLTGCALLLHVAARRPVAALRVTWALVAVYAVLVTYQVSCLWSNR